MPHAPSGSPSAELVTDLVGRYGKQIVQVFTALAGAAGLFYAIGFIIVNVSLLKLGVYETALISVGYIAPGVAFAIIFTLSALVSIGTFAAWRRILRMTRWPARLRLVLVVLLGSATVIAGAYAVGWAMWFFLNVATGVVIWCAAVGLGASVLAYAEYLPLVNRIVVQRPDADGNPLSRIQTRLKSPAFLLTSAALTFAGILVYGQFVYDQVPPVFGGGLPSIVRFFGDKVGDLEQIGIDLEPGETNVTERVRLIAQTEDRYIVREANRAISFDKSFVQGIRYEPPEFFLDPAFLRASRTRQGEQFFRDERYNEALSEFEFVLNEASDYVPALQGRVKVSLARKDFDQALKDYQRLTVVEPGNAENFYGAARTTVLLDVSLEQDIRIDNVVHALTQTATISPTLGERARGDPDFDPVRGQPAFDKAVYGSGPDAARWFRDRGAQLASDGNVDRAIEAYLRAVAYAEQYALESKKLNPGEVADLHIQVSALELQRDPLSTTALGELRTAAQVSGLGPIEQADIYVRLSEVYLRRDPLSNEAVGALQSAIEATGQKETAYLIRLAKLYSARNESEQAQDTYEIILQLSTANDPNRREALIGKGRQALNAGDYDQASVAFARALAISSNDAATLYDYARALAALNDPTTEGVLREALRLDSSLAETAQGEDWQKYFSGAGTAVANLIQGAAAARRAQALSDQGDTAGAIAAYQQATAADPSVASYWRKLGDLLAQDGEYVEAVAAYQNTLSLANPAELPDLYASLAEAQLSASDYAGAIQSFTESINRQTGAASASRYARLAVAYELSRQFDLAAATYDEAALRDPSNEQYPYWAGIDLLRAGQTDAGLAKLQPTLDQGGLRVASTDIAGLRAEPSADATVQTTLTIGAVLRIEGNPVAGESGEVWWPVRDQDGATGYVPAAGVLPAPPGVPSIPPISQSPLMPTP